MTEQVKEFQRMARHPKADEYEAIFSEKWDVITEEHIVSEVMAEKYIKTLMVRNGLDEYTLVADKTETPGAFIYTLKLRCKRWDSDAVVVVSDLDYPNGDAYCQAAIKLGSLVFAKNACSV